MHPNDATHDNQRHRREKHQTAVGIPATLGRIPTLGDNGVSEQRSRTEQFAEKSHDDQNQTVTQSVADTVEECRPRLISQGERLDAPHDDTVGDNQTDIDRKLFRNFENIGFQHLVDQNDQCGDDDQLNDDADPRRHTIAQQRHHQIGKGRDDGHRQRHDDSRLQLHGDGQRRTDTEDLHDDRIVRRERTGQIFEILSIHTHSFSSLGSCSVATGSVDSESATSTPATSADALRRASNNGR